MSLIVASIAVISAVYRSYALGLLDKPVDVEGKQEHRQCIARARLQVPKAQGQGQGSSRPRFMMSTRAQKSCFVLGSDMHYASWRL